MSRSQRELMLEELPPPLRAYLLSFLSIAAFHTAVFDCELPTRLYSLLASQSGHVDDLDGSDSSTEDWSADRPGQCKQTSELPVFWLSDTTQFTTSPVS